MGWLDELQYDYRYQCEDRHETHYTVPRGHDQSLEAQCGHCDKGARYVGLVPIKEVPVGKTSYDQNGRKAFRISSGNGNVIHMSQSKYEFLESGKITTCYTKEFEAHLRQDPAKNANLLGHDPNRRMGKASEYTPAYTPQELQAKAAMKQMKGESK